MKPVPKIGSTYKFYDDGKIRESRQYDATVLRIVPYSESKNILFPVYSDGENMSTEKIGEEVGEMSLHSVWLTEINEHICSNGIIHAHMNNDGTITEIKEGEPWLYSRETDYFIECSIPEYDEHTLWFVRTIRGGWFSLDIQNCWMGGILDVDNALTEGLNSAK